MRQAATSASSSLRQLIERCSDDASAHHNLGSALKAHGLPAEARLAWEEALQIDPGNAAIQGELRRLSP